MACVVPLTFYGFFVPRTSSVQEVCQRQLAGGSLSTSVTRSMNLVGAECSSDGALLTVNRTCVGSRILSRKYCQPHISARLSGHVVITGFWVGPDNEDGCGFVQAFLYQT